MNTLKSEESTCVELPLLRICTINIIHYTEFFVNVFASFFTPFSTPIHQDLHQKMGCFGHLLAHLGKDKNKRKPLEISSFAYFKGFFALVPVAGVEATSDHYI